MVSDPVDRRSLLTGGVAGLVSLLAGCERIPDVNAPVDIPGQSTPTSTATSKPAGDTTPPSIEILSAPDVPVYSSPEISARIEEDESRLLTDLLLVSYRTPTGEKKTVQFEEDGDNTYSATLDRIKGVGTLTFSITASDVNGNQASKVGTLEVVPEVGETETYVYTRFGEGVLPETDTAGLTITETVASEAISRGTVAGLRRALIGFGYTDIASTAAAVVGRLLGLTIGVFQNVKLAGGPVTSVQPYTAPASEGFDPRDFETDRLVDYGTPLTIAFDIYPGFQWLSEAIVEIRPPDKDAIWTTTVDLPEHLSQPSNSVMGHTLVALRNPIPFRFGAATGLDATNRYNVNVALRNTEGDIEADHRAVVRVRPPSNVSLSFEAGAPGDTSPPRPWQVLAQSGRISVTGRSSHGDVAIQLTDDGDLNPTAIGVDVDLTDVHQILADMYPVSVTPAYGFVKLMLDHPSTSEGGHIHVRDHPGQTEHGETHTEAFRDGEWHRDIEFYESNGTPLSEISGKHTLILYASGTNDVIWDNIRFEDEYGGFIPPTDVVVNS